MTITQLRYFSEVCKYNNISKAAECLCVSQPSVSRAIKELEEEYGVKFLLRHNNKLIMTEEGQIFRKYADKILSVLEEMEKVLKRRETNERIIKIGVPPSVFHFIIENVTSAIVVLKKKYKNLKIQWIEVTSENIEKRCQDHELDMVFWWDGQGIPSDYIVKDFCKVEIVLKVNKRNPLAARKNITMKDLTSQAVIQNFSNQSMLWKGVEEQCNKEQVALQYTYHVKQLSSILDLLNQNLGVCFHMAKISKLQSDDVVEIPLKTPIYTVLTIAYDETKAASPELQELLNELSGISTL